MNYKGIKISRQRKRNPYITYRNTNNLQVREYHKKYWATVIIMMMMMMMIIIIIIIIMAKNYSIITR